MNLEQYFERLHRLAQKEQNRKDRRKNEKKPKESNY